MPRPRKWRRVCTLPDTNVFGPPGADFQSAEVMMTVDEYETIRLIDVDGLTQEECAEQMNVARTTVQRMYYDARRKLGESLVWGKVLRIEGGDYLICDGRSAACRDENCSRKRGGRRNGHGHGRGGLINENRNAGE